MNNVMVPVAVCLAAGGMLVTFKIMGELDWSWLVVTSPWWGLVAFGALIYALACVLVGICLIKENEEWNERARD